MGKPISGFFLKISTKNYEPEGFVDLEIRSGIYILNINSFELRNWNFT